MMVGEAGFEPANTCLPKTLRCMENNALAGHLRSSVGPLMHSCALCVHGDWRGVSAGAASFYKLLI